MLTALSRLVLWALSLGAAGLFLGLALRRIPYPLELDYIEGVMMDHVVRLASGRPIYVAPTLDFITLAYMPGFATLSAALARVFGPEFWVPRVVSASAMLGIAALAIAVLRAETRRWTFAIAGAGVLLMSYGITGAHYDVGRPDSLMLLLSLGGLAVLRFTTGTRGALVAAALLTAGFFTKQHAVWFGIAGLAHLALNDRRRLPAFAAALLLGCAGGYALLTLWLGPWFPFFTWEVPTRWSQVSPLRILNYVGGGLLGSHALLVLPALLSLALAPRPWAGREGVWAWAGLAGIATGFMATLDPDAFRHVMNPTVVAFSVLGPLSLWRLARALGGRDERGALAVAQLVLCLQFIPLVYPVRAHLPHPGAARARAELRQVLGSHDGPVLMLYHGFYAWDAGKGTALQQITLDDVIRARGNSLLRRDPEYFERMFEERLVRGPDRPMIVTDVRLDHSGSESRTLWERVARHYRYAGELGEISQALNPVDGNHWTPRYLYLPLEHGEAVPPDPASPDPGPGTED